MDDLMKANTRIMELEGRMKQWTPAQKAAWINGAPTEQVEAMVADAVLASPTDKQIREAFGEWLVTKNPNSLKSLFPTREDQGRATQVVSRRLRDGGWDEDAKEAAYRVGVCIFGWEWPH